MFFKHNNIFPNLNSREARILKPLEVYKTVKKVVQSDTVFGAQKIRNLWRIYLKRKPESHEARIKLLTTGMSLRGVKVILFDKNPYANNEHNAEKANKDNCVTITFKDLPLSYDNSVLEGYLKDYHPDVKLRKQIRYACERDDITGDLTDCKNGDRFVKVEGPLSKPLPPTAAIGVFTCRIYHYGQESKIECWICNTKGHKAGSPKCAHYQVNADITTVNGHANVLSNFHPSKVSTPDGRVHKTAEHAWQFMKASRHGFTELAEDVATADHGGIAKRLVKDIDSKLIPEWKDQRLDLMEALLIQKMTEHEEFGNALQECGESIIAHSVPDRFWGTGLSAGLTEITKPENWPGQNHFGNLLMKIRNDTTNNDGENTKSKDEVEMGPSSNPTDKDAYSMSSLVTPSSKITPDESEKTSDCESIGADETWEDSADTFNDITTVKPSDTTSEPSAVDAGIKVTPKLPYKNISKAFKALVQGKIQFTPKPAVKRHNSGSPSSPERLRDVKSSKSTDTFDTIPEGDTEMTAVT